MRRRSIKLRRIVLLAVALALVTYELAHADDQADLLKRVLDQNEASAAAMRCVEYDFRVSIDQTSRALGEAHVQWDGHLTRTSAGAMVIRVRRDTPIADSAGKVARFEKQDAHIVVNAKYCGIWPEQHRFNPAMVFEYDDLRSMPRSAADTVLAGFEVPYHLSAFQVGQRPLRSALAALGAGVETTASERARSDGAKHVVIESKRVDRDGQRRPVYEITLDPQRSFSIVNVKLFDGRDHVSRETNIDLVEVRDGNVSIWLPSRVDESMQGLHSVAMLANVQVNQTHDASEFSVKGLGLPDATPIAWAAQDGSSSIRYAQGGEAIVEAEAEKSGLREQADRGLADRVRALQRADKADRVAVKPLLTRAPELAEITPTVPQQSRLPLYLYCASGVLLAGGLVLRTKKRAAFLRRR